MNKSFIIENAVKTAITTAVLLVCYAAITPVYAQEHEPMRERMIERMADRHSQMDKDLSLDQVRDIVEGRLAMMGNTNLKVGDVTETGDDTVAVDIVTQDDSLVQSVEISTRTGRPAIAERRFDRMRRGESGHFMGRQRRGCNLNSLALALGPRNRDLDLTVEQARTLAESRLILSGNERLKIGSVEAIDDDTITVEIVTVDDSLVVRREIDRDTGRLKRGK